MAQLDFGRTHEAFQRISSVFGCDAMSGDFLARSIIHDDLIAKKIVSLVINDFIKKIHSKYRFKLRFPKGLEIEDLLSRFDHTLGPLDTSFFQTAESKYILDEGIFHLISFPHTITAMDASALICSHYLDFNITRNAEWGITWTSMMEFLHIMIVKGPKELKAYAGNRIFVFPQTYEVDRVCDCGYFLKGKQIFRIGDNYELGPNDLVLVRETITGHWYSRGHKKI